VEEGVEKVKACTEVLTARAKQTADDRNFMLALMELCTE
jgi:hypothetical protein